MDTKIRKILPMIICGIIAALPPALLAQTPAPSISQAPEVGQGTSTSTVTPGGPLAPVTQSKGHGHGKGMEKIALALGLTPQQRASLRPIMQQRRSEMMAIRKESLPPEQKRAQMKAIRAASNQQIKSVLTPEQQQKLAQLMKARRQQQLQKQS